MELLPFDRAAEIARAVTGIHFTKEAMFEIGERIVNLERAYLVREGIRRRDDYLPIRFLKEPLPNGNSKGAIFEIEPMLDEYYAEREWNLRTGIPKAEKMRKIGLGYVVEHLKRNGVEIK
jgi:aldehyde:ferredoxin oxidoreductase